MYTEIDQYNQMILYTYKMSNRVIIYLLLTLLITECYAKRHRYSHGNKNSFVPTTYGGDLSVSSDTMISTRQYRQIISKTPCVGNYCVDNEWKCKKGNSVDCWNVEHIIDNNGPEFKNHKNCKNIAGNYIMAYGQWNQELGTLTKNHYQTSVNEKTRVYGEDIMNRARTSIRKCIENTYGKRALEEDIQINITNDVALEIDIGLLIIPEGTNVTCIDCNITTLECTDCMCDTCYIIPAIDQVEETIKSDQSYLYIGLLVVIMCMIFIIFESVVLVYIFRTRTHSNNYELQQ